MRWLGLFLLLPWNVAPPYDVLYVNANIYTGDPEHPHATSMVVHEGRITFLDKKVAAKTTIDLKGATVVPGFVDAHAHLGGLGRSLRRLNLVGTKTYDELLKRVEAWKKKLRAGAWIVGHGWNQEIWDTKTLPTHHRLSKITPDHPVFLLRIDGHAALANAKAMKIAGVNRNTKDPEGGDVIMGEDGEPTGIFIDTAEDRINRRAPGSSFEKIKRDLLAAQERCLQDGLVGVHDAGIGEAGIRAYQELVKEGKLKLRVYGMLSGGRWAIDFMKKEKPTTGERFSLRCVKLYVDGALGSRGAWLIKPYTDKPKNDKGEPNVGLNVTPLAELRAVSIAADENGYQVAIHAIGDRGNRESLKILKGMMRPRIEHAQVIAVKDIPLFKEYGVIASMQPTHATSDMNMAQKRVGAERIKGAYAWKTLLKQGTVIASGSDFPVESHKPLWGFFSAVARTDQDGKPKGGWYVNEAMTREQALRSFTWGSAYAAFEEETSGTLAPGMRADFVVLSKDIMKCEPGEILKTEVEMTVIGGEVVFQR